jgi:predicted transcriptional regulator
MSMSFAVDAMPIGEMMVASTTATMLSALERLFGDSATDMAKMLRVSRPMVYHYREGMEPSVENRRRLQTLAMLANDWGAMVSQPLRGALKAKQPEGLTLLELLSAQELDVVALRKMLQRNIETSDQTLRKNLADSLACNESAEARGDIKRARHAEGKPVYIGDPNAPGTLIQILPDGSRVRGRMVKRQFVPDDE